MSTAMRHLENATIISSTVAGGQAATAGRLALLASDTTCQNGGANSDLGVGVFLDTAIADAPTRIAFGGVVPVLVGTGAATRGKKAKHNSDGFCDAPTHDSSGTTDDAVYGVFMQSGVLGDFVGLQWCPTNRGSA